MHRSFLALLFVVLLPVFAAAAELKAGWTPELLASETDECTDALVLTP
jgi:hypothetical protein